MGDILDRFGIEALWYVTHINNLESILKEGILCRNLVKELGLEFEDISEHNVQSQREKKHDYVHDYVPLFFAHNTPMLYVTVSEYGESVILLELEPKVMYKERVIFADGNIAAFETTIYSDLCELENLNWKVIFSESGAYYRGWKRIRAAEVLVPARVERNYIQAIHVQNKSIYSKIQRLLRKNKQDIKVLQDLHREGIITVDLYL